MIIKVDGKLATAAADALTPHAHALYSHLGRRIVIIGELEAVERNELAPDEDKDSYVKLRVSALEVANDALDEPLRRALVAMTRHRTAYGTLLEDGEIELSEQTIKQLAGDVNAVEAARRGVALQRWAEYAARACGTPKISHSELLHELRAVADGLLAAVRGDK